MQSIGSTTYARWTFLMVWESWQVPISVWCDRDLDAWSVTVGLRGERNALRRRDRGRDEQKSHNMWSTERYTRPLLIPNQSHHVQPDRMTQSIHATSQRGRAKRHCSPLKQTGALVLSSCDTNLSSLQLRNTILTKWKHVRMNAQQMFMLVSQRTG